MNLNENEVPENTIKVLKSKIGWPIDLEGSGKLLTSVTIFILGAYY